MVLKITFIDSNIDDNLMQGVGLVGWLVGSKLVHFIKAFVKIRYDANFSNLMVLFAGLPLLYSPLTSNLVCSLKLAVSHCS